jgi:hypothetical protein
VGFCVIGTGQKLTSDSTSEPLFELTVKQAQTRRNAGPTPHDRTYPSSALLRRAIGFRSFCSWIPMY